MARQRKQLEFRALASALTDSGGNHSMAAIARRLGVAKPTLYRIAGSRDELIRIAIDAEAERLLDHIHRAGIRGLHGYAADSPAGFHLLFGDRYPQARQAVRRIEARLGAALRRDRALAEAETAAAGLLGLAAGVVRRSLEDAGRVDPERLGTDFDDVAKLAARISSSVA